MPNWCDNSVTITASKEKIDAIEAGLKLSEQVLFESIRPRPETEEENWYEWNVNNWGTKWEASVHDFNRESDNTIWVSFDSAWSPPIELYEWMSENEYEVLAYYHEGGMGFIGKYEDGYDECYEYSFSDRESIENLPEDLIDYADLLNQYDEWAAENETQDGEEY